MIRKNFKNIISTMCLLYIVLLVLRHKFVNTEIDINTHLKDIKYIILVLSIYLSIKIEEILNNKQN
jgi:hypothetical protein